MDRLFPGHSFIVVNNNAAAIMLCLRALSHRREVLVSRGELVEIGGSFRMPDILAASGARLREVGTTNRTRLADYRKAISSRTGMILKVHTSNFRIVGFTEEAPIFDLAALAREKKLPLVVDWGSGDLVELEPLGIRDEVPALEVLNAGADLVTFSGDKLLGGPQAGFVVGKPELVEKLRDDPLARVCRLDRLLIAAMARTLSAYVRGRQFEEVPTLRMLKLSKAEIGRRASKVKSRVASLTRMGKMLALVDGASRTGGGSSPMGERPTKLLAVKWPTGDAATLERRLRECDPPVIARMQEGRLLLDLRTVLPGQDQLLAELLAGAMVRR
jgi:L-seryl-tRNA(Ser) seleniumtransferase